MQASTRKQHRPRKPPFIADLDSATSALQATANYLWGEDKRPLRWLSPAAPLIAPVLDALPNRLAELMYSWGGWIDAIPARRLSELETESVSQGIIDMYPRRRYPAVMIGSTNGAAVHLAAALGVPWIPQTLLIVVRRHLHPDEPRKDLEWAREPVRRLTERNRDIRVYQHHDSNQDRLMLRHMAYFRIKRLKLGPTLEAFIRDVLEPGGTILSLECDYSWPSTQVDERHIFQFGGRGGITTEEYFDGGPRVEEFLKRVGSPHQQWDPPEPTGSYPEAEWGFDPELREDIVQFAQAHGYRARQIAFDDPQALSAPVAEAYRAWYRGAGHEGNNLLVESFTHVHPHLAVRLGLVPYWSVFNGYPSLEELRRYLEQVDPYESIGMTIFSNSIEGVGIASLEEWRSVLAYARRGGKFIGVNEKRYPRDLASFVRHYSELKKFGAATEPPERLTLRQLGTWFATFGRRYGVSLSDPEEHTEVNR